MKYVIVAKGERGFIVVNKPCSRNLERITSRAKLLRQKSHVKEVQVNNELGDRVITL